MKKLSNTEAELKISIAYKKSMYFYLLCGKYKDQQNHLWKNISFPRKRHLFINQQHPFFAQRRMTERLTDEK